MKIKTEYYNISPNWLTANLQSEIRRTFEPRYKKKLSDEEVLNIAENLTEVMETYLKLKCKQKYGHART